MNTSRKKKWTKYLYRCASHACFLALAASVWAGALQNASAAPTREEELAGRQAKNIETNDIPNWPPGPVVSADSAILMDADTGAILYAKDIHARHYPASTTKILTCLIAAERCQLDEIVTFSHDAIFDTPRDSNNIALDEGEKLTMEQALNAILIRSANEAAFGVAEHIAGSGWQDFAQIMNERARELGCVDSNFVNPNGLPDENHYTSAFDLATIGRAFFANELLCKISTAKILDIPPSDLQPDPIYEHSSNELLPGRKYAYEYLVGTKTGFTNAARSCLVSCAEKDGMKLICVVLRDEAPYQYEDTIALFDYGFGNFDRINIAGTETKYDIDNSNFFYSSNDIFGSSKPILSLNPDDCLILPKTASFADAQSSLSYEAAGENQVAVISYTYQGQFIGSVSVDLAADNTASYSFESGLAQAGQPGGETKDGKKENVIFINVVKVILWILGVAGAIIVVIVANAFINNYQFSGRDRSNRRSWRRSRRRKRSRGRAAQAAAVRRRRGKRPSRFRDYDY